MTEPSSERMRDAWALYDAGDMLRARAKAQEILRDANGTERTDAQDLLARQRFPKAAWAWGGLALFLILLIGFIGFARGH